MKPKTKPDSLADIVRDLAKAMKPSARNLTKKDVEGMIADVRREAKAAKIMKQSTQFALCIENLGNEASLILGKVYRILPDARAAKDNLLRIIDESGEDYLFNESQFVRVEFPDAVKKKILAIQSVGR